MISNDIFGFYHYVIKWMIGNFILATNVKLSKYRAKNTTYLHVKLYKVKNMFIQNCKIVTMLMTYLLT